MKRLAPAALMPPAAFAVHQLRYWLAYGNHAGIELQRQGHSYLHSLAPWIVVLVALAIGTFLCALGRAFSGQRSLPRYTVSFAALWLICSTCLVGIYVGQELLEGVLATGHPLGLAGVFGYGGWWSLPAAACVGLVLTAVFHSARWVLHEVARRRACVAQDGAPVLVGVLRPRDAFIPRPAPLAAGASGRGPPV